jgi:hypothetical protein
MSANGRSALPHRTRGCDVLFLFVFGAVATHVASEYLLDSPILNARIYEAERNRFASHLDIADLAPRFWNGTTPTPATTTLFPIASPWEPTTGPP